MQEAAVGAARRRLGVLQRVYVDQAGGGHPCRRTGRPAQADPAGRAAEFVREVLHARPERLVLGGRCGDGVQAAAGEVADDEPPARCEGIDQLGEDLLAFREMHEDQPRMDQVERPVHPEALAEVVPADLDVRRQVRQLTGVDVHGNDLGRPGRQPGRDRAGPGADLQAAGRGRQPAPFEGPSARGVQEVAEIVQMVPAELAAGVEDVVVHRFSVRGRGRPAHP